MAPCLLAFALAAAPVPDGTVEVDLTPLRGVTDLNLHPTVRRGNELLFDWPDACTFEGGATDKQLIAYAEHIIQLMNEDDDDGVPSALKAELVKGKPVIRVRAKKRGGLLAVRFEAVGLPEKNQPKVSRLKEEKKEDKKDKK